MIIVDPYSIKTLKKGLVAAWEMDETSGLTCYDSHTGGYNGTIPTSNVTINQTGKIGKAYEYSGGANTNKLVTTLTTALTNPSYSIWLYLHTNTATNVVFHKSSEIYLAITTARKFNLIATHSTTSGNWLSNGTITLNTWTHIVVIYNSTSTSNSPILYINGVNETMGTTTAPVGTHSTNSNAYNFGNHVTSSLQFDGLIDQTLIYNRLLTDQEVLKINNKGNGLSYLQL